VHFRKGEVCVDVVELGKFVGEVVNFFSRKLVKDVFSEFPDFIADAVRAVERRIGLENPARGWDIDLFESEEVLVEEDLVFGQNVPDRSFQNGKGRVEAANFDQGVDVAVLFFSGG
jgi:hypothetical protein